MKRCDNCAPEFGCWDNSEPCRKRARDAETQGAGAGTLTKAMLAQEVALGCGIPVRLAEAVLQAVINEIAEALRVGQRVEIRGFVSLRTVERRARMARNPKTGAPAPVAAKRVVRGKWLVELAGGCDGADHSDAHAPLAPSPGSATFSHIPQASGAAVTERSQQPVPDGDTEGTPERSSLGSVPARAHSKADTARGHAGSQNDEAQAQPPTATPERKAIADEPEYPGDCPPMLVGYIRQAIQDKDEDAILHMMRQTVRLTKECITERVNGLRSNPGSPTGGKQPETL